MILSHIDVCGWVCLSVSLFLSPLPPKSSRPKINGRTLG